jgi:hypothetical protein
MTYENRQNLLDALCANAPEAIAREIAEQALYDLRQIEPLIDQLCMKAFERGLAQGKLQTWFELAWENYCRTEQCPKCGSFNVGAQEVDFGTCRETGYHDAGVMGICYDCGLTAAGEDFAPNVRV